ncbi:L-threonylcarbamoyladenylate synthase [Chitinivorax sp. B]|uniref:L-threonylcarbamoyladenylate synthase n=1 Tax=Chitinivorax sp. B TaxID=2502235 RepID=UPI0014850F15|nr:L-threonylcarbamoyladenylate synthase [Chitinivorax sp. B]
MRQPRAGELPAMRRQIRQGGVIAYATESCYGLGCDPRQWRAVQRVIRLKRRPAHKGLIMIAASFEQLAPFVQSPTAAERALLDRFWPGPYTFIMRASRRAHRLLTGRHGTIAVRVTAHPGAAGVCRALGTALVSTSANLAGQVSLKSARACHRAFGKRVHVVAGQTGRRKKPSTIIDLRTGKVLR